MTEGPNKYSSSIYDISDDNTIVKLKNELASLPTSFVAKIVTPNVSLLFNIIHIVKSTFKIPMIIFVMIVIAVQTVLVAEMAAN